MWEPTCRVRGRAGLLPICDDERQFVPRAGQSWTTLTELRRSHRNAFQRLEPDLFGIGTTPEFAIGQRALLQPVVDRWVVSHVHAHGAQDLVSP